MSAGTGLSKITFGNNIPGWATSVSKSPAVIVLQVALLEHLSTTLATVTPEGASCLTYLPCTGVVGSDRRGEKTGAVPTRAEGLQVSDRYTGLYHHLTRTHKYPHAYRVLIPDLYKGKIGVDAEEASHVCPAHEWHVV